jgi:hypothetical protein
MNKPKLNKYDKAILFNPKLLKIIFLAIVLLNLFMPLFSPASMGYKNFFQWYIIVVHAVGLTYALGGVKNIISLTSQHIPFVHIFVIRCLEVLWHTLVSSTKFNWMPLLMVLILDLLFIVLLFMDKREYRYEIERE